MNSTTDPINRDDKDAKRVQKTASVAPATVEAVGRGEVAPAPRRRRQGRRTPPVAPLHTHIQLDARVLAKVQEIISEGSYTRYEIVDHETAVVR